MKGLSELFLEICNWAVLKGAMDLIAKPGVWTENLGELVITINAHKEEAKDSQGVTMRPMSASVHNPKYVMATILVDPTGGIGPPGMEDEVLAALKADIARLEAEA